MTISKVEDGYLVKYETMGFNDEGKRVLDDRRELRCLTLEEAEFKANEYLKSMGLDTEIVYT